MHRLPLRKILDASLLLPWLAIGMPSPASAVAAPPSISITALPDYGESGSVEGRVVGVDPALHRVATYGYVDGAGWCSKPTQEAPTVPIAPDSGTPAPDDGTFSALVTTGGVDTSAILYCVALFPVAQTPPFTCGGARLPELGDAIATACAQRAGREIAFAGRHWGVKEAPLPVGPGTNLLSLAEDDVFVDDAGKLHLTLRQEGDASIATEVFLLEPLGYGIYELTTESDLASLDASATFGAFTWDPFGDATGAGLNPNREIDLEASRWGNPLDPTNAQAVVQPYWLDGNLERFAIGAGVVRWRIRWQSGRVDFEVLQGSSAIYAWSHEGASVPDAGRAVFHVNLWRNQSAANAPAEVVVGAFEYTPEPITAAGVLCAFVTLALLARRESRRVGC